MEHHGSETIQEKPTARSIERYDVPAPRYTSYPPVPSWEGGVTEGAWLQALREEGPSRPISCYVHVPFCESLCLYCACNTTITKDHRRERRLVDAILAEVDFYRARLTALPPLQSFHLGGGTPNFLSPENLEKLVRGIWAPFKPTESDFEASIELDPRTVTQAHCEMLARLKFTRVSLGVQDFDPEVQRNVNRIQSFEMTRSLVQQVRKLGIREVNIDLIFGLPGQTPGSIAQTVRKILELRPQRIAMYSMAVVPSMKAHHGKLFKDVVKGYEKWELQHTARIMFCAAGYHEIGMDHFALPDDGLSIAFQKGRLHRNFMGYTSKRTPVLLGLGPSAISEAPEIYRQNEVDLDSYYKSAKQGVLASKKSHRVSERDKFVRERILQLMTRRVLRTKLELLSPTTLKELWHLTVDGLIELEPDRISVTSHGLPFLRNICSAFDERTQASARKNEFSQAI